MMVHEAADHLEIIFHVGPRVKQPPRLKDSCGEIDKLIGEEPPSLVLPFPPGIWEINVDSIALVTQYEGTIANDQGVLDAAKLNVTYSHIAAPITGIVGLRLVDPGNIVHATDSNGMIVITQIQPISAIFPIAEDQLQPIMQKFRAGQTLTVEAWDRQLKNKLATGTLSTVDNQIDQTTGTLKLRATFQNENRTLFPNQFVNTKLLQQEKTGVTLLPSAAIQRNTTDTFVYLIQPDSTVTVRKISVGTTEGDQSEITSGLNPGDKVVMTGVDKLEEGTKVAATMNTQK